MPYNQVHFFEFYITINKLNCIHIAVAHLLKSSQLIKISTIYVDIGLGFFMKIFFNFY
jgi:hypothetical protein